MEKTVRITNTDVGRVVIVSSDYSMRRELTPGRTIEIPENVFQELTFDDGFQNLVTNGIIRVENVEDNGTLNQPEAGTSFTLQEIRALFEQQEFAKLKKMLPKATNATKNVIAQCAIEMNITDNAFCAAIKKYCDIDVIQAITTKRQATEE